MIIRSLLLIAICSATSFPANAADLPRKQKVLVVTGGHGFAREPFFKMFVDNPDITFTEAKQGKSSQAYDRNDLLSHDVIVLYDMVQNITDEQKTNFLALFDKGVGVVALHHSLVSYQNWAEFERIIGGTYPEPQDKKGKVTEELGYEHDVQIPVVISARDHFITKKMREFTIRDEIYWGYRTRPDVLPLLTTTHPKSGKPLAWTRTEKNSRVVYIQLGHGPEIFKSTEYRGLISRSIIWAGKREG